MTTATADQIRDRALRGGLLYVGARLSLQTFQWLVTLLVARLLIAEDYGLMAAAGIVTEFAALLGAGGFGAALVQAPQVTRRLEAEAFTLSLVVVALLYAAIWFLAPMYAAHFGRPEFATFLRVVSVTLWLVPIGTVTNAILEREMRLPSLAASLVVSGAVQAAIVFFLAWSGFGAWSLGAGALCGSLVQTAASWWQSGWRPTLGWPRSSSLDLVRFGFTTSLTSLIWYFYSNSDKAVVSAVLGPVVLGVYAITFQLISLPVEKLTASVNKVAFVTFCRLRDDPERLREWYLRLIASLFALCAPALVGAALIADDAIPFLLGEQWRSAVLPFQVLAPVGVVMVLATTLPPLLNALGRPGIPLLYTIVCSAIYPLAFAVTAKRWGLNGICATWLVLYPVQAIALAAVSRPITGISLYEMFRKLAPFVEALAAMVCAVVVTRAVLVHSAVPARMLASIVVGVVVYSQTISLAVGHGAAAATLSFLRGALSGK